jgi:hypothetical protein
MSRRTIAAVLTALLLSVEVGVTPAPAGEWSPEYRAVLASTLAKRREHRARHRWIRRINNAVSASILQEVMTYPDRLQQEMAWRSVGGGGDSSESARRSRDRDESRN